MLDKINYTDENIESKTIIEPSFGDGAFLVVIVERILEYAEKKNLSEKNIYNILDNVYGIEIDEKLYETTICRLNKLLQEHGLNYEWKNLVCENSLDYISPIKFDLCVGNPPYTKIQHLNTETRAKIEEKYEFGKGNTDLYVVFFELCLKLMNEQGKMCFITPNSYFKNSSQKALRNHFIQMNYVEEIIDYGTVNVFGEIATYTAITMLNFNKPDNNTKYFMMKNEREIEYETTVDLTEFINKNWVFVNDDDKKFLENISQRKTKLKDICDIQHGISTNADKVYIIKKEDFNRFEKDILRPVLKASTLNLDNKIIFPYQWNSDISKFEVIKEDIMKKLFPNTYKYLLLNKQTLENRDMEKKTMEWYQYARSQGIQNCNKRKIVLKHIISKNGTLCEIKEADENTLVYSGIYIIVKNDENYEFVKKILLSEDFHRYLFLVGKDMAGGYKNVSAKFVKEYGILLENEKEIEIDERKQI